MTESISHPSKRWPTWVWVFVAIAALGCLIAAAMIVLTVGSEQYKGS